MQLTYKILGKRPMESYCGTQDEWDVEWTIEDGEFQDTIEAWTGSTVEHNENGAVTKVTHHYETIPAGKRKIIKDQINVKSGTPQSIVMQLLEEKRPALIKALGG